jgi:hypothetical protein
VVAKVERKSTESVEKVAKAIAKVKKELEVA